MGLLTQGTPLAWSKSEPYRERVKTDGVSQFLSVYYKTKDFKDHQLKWGDEVEYLLVKLDYNVKKATLSLTAPQLLEQLQKEENSQPLGASVPTLWRPEYPRWMIEGTPGVPYGCYATDLVNVERNMALRRSQVNKLLGPGEVVISIPVFPRTGCGIFTTPPTLPLGPVARSIFISDDVISPHPRFPTLTRNIRQRRGRKVDIRMPLFMDKNTKALQTVVPQDTEHLSLLKHAHEKHSKKEQSDEVKSFLTDGLMATANQTIVMDSAPFGMGAACLQVTIQGRDLGETRYLYDQLAVMAPLMLALTAGTPILRGLLADTDVRWNVIADAMDDRTQEEISSGKVPKSRYSSIDCFLSNRAKLHPEDYNDLPINIHEGAYEQLIEGGVDHMLAQHIAHLFIRDPLAIYEEKVDQDNDTSTDHFENIQSTNWNTVRFKLPPPGTDIGWRTEFRSMEVGITDFENAAFSVFVVLLSRVILAFNLNFYIPMSKVDENMNIAHLRDAAVSQEFYFRKNIFKSSDGSDFLCDCGHIHTAHIVGGHSNYDDIDNFCPSDCDSNSSDSENEPYEPMSLDDIFNGKPLCRNGKQEGFAFPGLIPLVRGYLDALNIECETRSKLLTYLDFISARASGELCTNAAYMRNFVENHPSYKQDSIVSSNLCFDLMTTVNGISNGDIAAPELLGRYQKEGVRGDVETSATMLKLLQNTPVGKEATPLYGSGMPSGVLENAFRSIVTQAREGTRCGC